MKELIHSFLHICRILVTVFGKLIALIVPKKKNLILFSSWFGKKYSDSPMYMYDYILKNTTDFKAVWYTKNIDLYKELKEEGKPVVYEKSLKGFWTQLRAKVLVSSVEFYDYNIYFLCNCVLLDLNHGFPIKQSGFEIPTYNIKQQRYDRLLRWKVKLYKTASSEFIKDIISKAEDLSVSSIIFCNKPRMDAFYDLSLRLGYNEVVKQIKGTHKAIVYMPTHRMAGKKPINIKTIFNLDLLEKFCEANDCVFLIKKHFYHNKETSNLEEYSRIFDITQEKLEVQTLLYQADVLISDYSASYIDYLMLDRPIVYYAYDFEEFTKNERGLYIRFDDIKAGYKAFTFDDLMSSLKKITFDWKDEKHKKGRDEMRKIYFDEGLPEGKTREDILNIIRKLIKGNYNSKWI